MLIRSVNDVDKEVPQAMGIPLGSKHAMHHGQRRQPLLGVAPVIDNQL
jgi:hypothetical protein